MGILSTRIAKFAAVAAVAGLLVTVPAFAAPSPVPAHAVGTVTWQFGFPRYDLPRVGPFAFDGGFDAGTKLLAGRVHGAVGVLNVATLTYTFAISGVVSGMCVAPSSPSYEFGLTAPYVVSMALTCTVRANGGKPTTLTMNLVGVLTNTYNDPNIAGPVYTFTGIFAG